MGSIQAADYAFIYLSGVAGGVSVPGNVPMPFTGILNNPLTTRITLPTPSNGDIIISSNGLYQILLGYGSTDASGRNMQLNVDGVNLSNDYILHADQASPRGMNHSISYIFRLSGAIPHTLNFFTRNAQPINLNGLRGAAGLSPAGPAIWLVILKLQ